MVVQRLILNQVPWNQASTENHFDNLADILPEETLDPLGSKLRAIIKDYKASRKDWEDLT